jgi:signal transduction histidine kinase/DNA-binding response OmpR family regulator
VARAKRARPAPSPGRAERLARIRASRARLRADAREREELLAREQAARAQAEAATHARDQFLAVVSHELRSPLNGIQSWAHVAEQQVAEPTPTFRRAMAGIRKGIGQQVRLIEDLLDATRILSGQLRLARRPCALRPILDAALESIRPGARAKNLRLVIDLRLQGEQVQGDPDRLQQILWNLLDNAVKFVPHGGTLWITAAAGDGTAVITVRDNGKGIPPEFLPLLFDRFRQADNSSTRRHEGLGLGLALVRHIAELHGGHVQAESPGRGRGATFTLSLPLWLSFPARAKLPRTIARGTSATPSLAGCRALVIDDQEEARESLAALLGNAGASVLTAESCAAALALLESGANGLLPDVLLCDIAMPEEDGYATLRRIRAWEARRGRAPMAALALTAFAQREDRIKALAGGFRLHLTKPVSPAALIGAIAAAQSARKAGRARGAAAGMGVAGKSPVNPAKVERERGDIHESPRRDDDRRAADPGRREREQRRQDHAGAGHRLPAGRPQ